MDDFHFYGFIVQPISFGQSSFYNDARYNGSRTIAELPEPGQRRFDFARKDEYCSMREVAFGHNSIYYRLSVEFS